MQYFAYIDNSIIFTSSFTNRAEQLFNHCKNKMKAKITPITFPCQSFADATPESLEFFNILKAFIESTNKPIPFEDTLLFPKAGDRILHREQMTRHDGSLFIAYLPYIVTEETDRGWKLTGTGDGEMDAVYGINHGGVACSMQYAAFAWPNAVKSGEIVYESSFSIVKN